VVSTAAAEPEPQSLLVVDGVSKSFLGRRVLDEVSLTVDRGELLGLAGHNGSGKSTLVKILAGYHKPDPGGAIFLDRKPLEENSRSAAFVHQDLALVDSATVLENMCLASYPQHRWGGIDWRQTRRQVRSALARLALDVPMDVMVGTLDPTTKALVAIARALGSLEDHGLGLLVLDEPTAYLPEDGAERLFGLIKTACERGFGVVLVTHSLKDITNKTDSVAVLRDGQCVYHGSSRDLPLPELVDMIVVQALVPPARDGEAVKVTQDAATPGIALRVRGLEIGNVRIEELEVARGEVVGITGLVGSGYAVPLYAIFDGRHRGARGEVEINGTGFDLRKTTPALMVRGGVALIPADRLAHGGIQAGTIRENATLLSLDHVRRPGYRIGRRAEAQFAADMMKRYGVANAEPNNNLEQLSGGNQQKMILGKWLAANPSILLLDEPTHGMDVGACQAVYEMIRQACRNGVSPVVASGDTDVLTELCDRVVVMRRGRVVATLTGSEITEGNIVGAAGLWTLSRSTAYRPRITGAAAGSPQALAVTSTPTRCWWPGRSSSWCFRSCGRPNTSPGPISTR
jgi:ribose transport system ATP-binding protein